MKSPFLGYFAFLLLALFFAASGSLASDQVAFDCRVTTTGGWGNVPGGPWGNPAGGDWSAWPGLNLKKDAHLRLTLSYSAHSGYLFQQDEQKPGTKELKVRVQPSNGQVRVFDLDVRLRPLDYSSTSLRFIVETGSNGRFKNLDAKLYLRQPTHQGLELASLVCDESDPTQFPELR